MLSSPMESALVVYKRADRVQTPPEEFDPVKQILP